MQGTGSQSLPRRRTFLACDACKFKKSRCDGDRPKCGRCMKVDVDCVYTLNDRDKRMAQRNSWIARQYLNQPSRADASAPTAPRTSSSPVEMDGDTQDTPSTINSEHVPRPLLRQPARDMKPKHTSPSDPPMSESLADVLATNAFDQLSNGEVGYFGSSTNHGFFWCLSGAIANLGYKASRSQAQRASPTSDMRGSRSSVLRKSLTHTTLHESIQKYPSNEELVARFFDNIGYVLPYVDEVSIMGKLHVLDEDANESCPSTQSWQALLNIVLAYALYTIDGPSPEPFYRRVINLLYGMAIHLSTIQTLQALLLLSSFEQNIRRSMASLSSHSLAVRTAYHLGLHAPPTYVCLGADEQRLRARLWLATVTQDRILSACFGRPCLIGMNYVRPEIAKIVSVGEFSEVETRTLAINNTASFFALLTSLHEVTGLALDKIYLSNIGSVRELPTEHLLSEVLNLSIRLDNWVNCNKLFGIMNAEVGFGNWVAPSEDAERLAIILSLHYHRVVLLVHGAIVMRSLECLTTVGPQFLSGVTGDTIVAMLRRNLVAARDTHYVICEVLQKRLGFLETNALWWICNYSAFTTCLHSFGLWVLSSHISDTRVSSIGTQEPDLEILLQAALRNLRKLGGMSMLSSKAYQRLQGLFDLLRDKDSASKNVSSPRESRDEVRNEPLPTQDSSWAGRQPETVQSIAANHTLLSLDEYGPDSSFGFLRHQDAFGFGIGIADYDDFGSIIEGSSGAEILDAHLPHMSF